MNALLLQAFVTVLLLLGSFAIGHREGRMAATAEHQAAAATARELGHLQAMERARADTSRATATGARREAERGRIDTFFTRLAEEARHDTPAAVDACELPADRLRRWADANAGPAAEGAAPAQPDGAASAAAATGLWPHARLGSQPPAGGPRLSPAGQPAVRFAGLPGG